MERMKRTDKDWKTMNRMMTKRSMAEEEGEEKASVTEEGGQEELKEEE